VVNFRMLPGDTIDIVQASGQAAIADERSSCSAARRFEASVSRSPTPSPYQLINRTVREVFPDAHGGPGPDAGGTDSRHFADISEAHLPLLAHPRQARGPARLHGTDERIAARNLADMVRFYHRLLQQSRPPTESS
jgi:carboxypeptidase PM20D1